MAAEPAYNIGTGAIFLIQKWNGLSVYIGNNNSYVVEDWYYAVWTYNGWGMGDVQIKIPFPVQNHSILSVLRQPERIKAK